MQIMAMTDTQNSLKSDLKAKEERNEQCLEEIKSLQEELAALKQSVTAKQEEDTNLVIEKNQKIHVLEQEIDRITKEKADLVDRDEAARSTFEETISDLKEKVQSDEGMMEELKQKLAESQNETAEVLSQSKQHIQRLKSKFEDHQIEVCTPTIPFVLIVTNFDSP